MSYVLGFLAENQDLLILLLTLVLGWFVKDGVKAKKIAKELADVVNELTTLTEHSGKIDNAEDAKAISTKADEVVKRAK